MVKLYCPKCVSDLVRRELEDLQSWLFGALPTPAPTASKKL